MLLRFHFHEIGQDIVDARQVSFAFGLQPVENARIQAHADRYLWPDVARADHASQLLGRHSRDVAVVDTGVVAGGLLLGDLPQGSPLFSSPFPVVDIFGRHADRLFAPR